MAPVSSALFSVAMVLTGYRDHQLILLASTLNVTFQRCMSLTIETLSLGICILISTPYRETLHRVFRATSRSPLIQSPTRITAIN